MQLDLIPTPRPAVNDQDIHRLLTLLADRDWLTASAISALASFAGHAWSDRKIRAIANASAGQIISGQNGYKLTRHATLEEIRRASTWLRHQADEMRQRAIDIDRVYHRVTRPM